MKWLAVFLLVFILGVVLLSNLGYGSQISGFLHYVPGRDTTMHVVLPGLLAFTLVGWLAPRFPPWRVTWVLALFITLEEGSQAWIPARTFSQTDLAASLVGVLLGSLAAQRLPARPRARSAA